MGLTTRQASPIISKSRQLNPVLSPLQVKDLIADGHIIVLLNERVLKLDSWLKLHPGGDNAILHVIGKDATDEINAYVRTRSNLTIYSWLIQLM
jgi:delta8-fatty-acid desaturase